MALFRKGPVGKPGEWYYCVKHHKVEEGPECRAADRLGPYGSPEEAGRALETAQERNAQWQNDPRWQDDAPGGGASRDGTA